MASADHEHNAHRRIDEEQVTVDAMKYVLCTHCGCLNVSIHREEHDPPDFTVTIDGKSFPTEVTCVVLNPEYSAHCREFADIVRKQAERLGALSGRYALKIQRLPHIPKSTSETGRQLLKRAVAYIQATQQQSTSPEELLVRDNTGKIGIMKISNQGSSVGLIRIPPGMRMSKTQSELTMKIQHAVDEKRRKFENKSIGPGKALLLLYDAYNYAEPEDAMLAMEEVTGYDWYHSIFWAASFKDQQNTTYPEEPGRDGIFLFSHNPRWSGTRTV